MSEQTPENDLGNPDAPIAITPDLLDYATEDDLMQIALDYAQAALPEWSPHAGNQEVVLLESLAQMTTILAFAVQQAPEQLLEHLMRIYGIIRDDGAPTRSVALFEVSGTESVYEIPAGTTLRATIEATGETVDFETRGSLQIDTANSRTGAQPIIAQENGANFNGIPAGTTLSVQGSLPFLERVTLRDPTVGGRDEETDANFQGRASAVLSRQVATIVVAEHFQLAALEQPGVGRAKDIDLYDPTDSSTPPGQSAGHISVAVADIYGQPLSAEEKDDIREELRAQALASLIIHVIDPDYTDVSLDITVQANSGATVEAVEANVTARLERFLSPSRWDWSDTIEQFSLVAQVSAVPGVQRVISAPANISLPGLAPLPRPQNINVTVTEDN